MGFSLVGTNKSHGVDWNAQLGQQLGEGRNRCIRVLHVHLEYVAYIRYPDNDDCSAPFIHTSRESPYTE